MVYSDEKKCAQEANDMVGRRLSVLWIFGALTGAVGQASGEARPSNTSHAILAPPHRLALCFTGLINHGEPNGVTGPNLRAALSRPEQLERLGKWLTSIRALHVKVDIWWVKKRATSTPTTTTVVFPPAPVPPFAVATDRSSSL